MFFGFFFPWAVMHHSTKVHENQADSFPIILLKNRKKKTTIWTEIFDRGNNKKENQPFCLKRWLIENDSVYIYCI